MFSISRRRFTPPELEDLDSVPGQERHPQQGQSNRDGSARPQQRHSGHGRGRAEGEGEGEERPADHAGDETVQPLGVLAALDDAMIRRRPYEEPQGRDEQCEPGQGRVLKGEGESVEGAFEDAARAGPERRG